MAKAFKRTDRIADAIQKELALIIQREMRDPRVGLITVASVKVSKDLAHAKVFISVMIEGHATETIKTLNKAASFLGVQLAKRVSLRVMPQLSFIYDDTTLKAIRLSKLIDEALGKDLRPKEQDEPGTH
jgi:ribosome-binding factor A